MTNTSASSPRLNTPTVANITVPSTHSARMLSSVWDTSVPSTTGKRSRMRPRRRDMISAREGSPSRAGRVADMSTPIIVARAVSRRRTRMPGMAARRIACQASARISMEAHIRTKPRSTHTGVAARSALAIDSMPRRLSARAVRPTPATAPAPTATRRAVRALRRRPCAGSVGSSDGSFSGGVRGPGSVGVRPMRRALRASPRSGTGSSTARS